MQNSVSCKISIATTLISPLFACERIGVSAVGWSSCDQCGWWSHWLLLLCACNTGWSLKTNLIFIKYSEALCAEPMELGNLPPPPPPQKKQKSRKMNLSSCSCLRVKENKPKKKLSKYYVFFSSLFARSFYWDIFVQVCN